MFYRFNKLKDYNKLKIVINKILKKQTGKNYNTFNFFKLIKKSLN